MTAVARRPLPNRGPRLHAVLPRFGWRHEVLRVAAVYLLYESIRVLPSLHLTDAVANGHSILNAEQRLHVAPERSLNLWLFDLPDGFAVAAAYYYEVLHYLITPAVLIWMFRTNSGAYRRARNSLVAMTLPSLAVFWMFPVVPPRLLGGTGIHDIVAEQHRWGWWSSGGTAPNGLGGLVNEFAAMPSLHVGWAFWCGVQLIRHARHRITRALGAAYPLLTALVVMATGNHYLADAVAGTAVAVFGGVVAWVVDLHGGGKSPRPRNAPGQLSDAANEPLRAGRLSDLDQQASRSSRCSSSSRSSRSTRPSAARSTRAYRQSWSCPEDIGR